MAEAAARPKAVRADQPAALADAGADPGDGVERAAGRGEEAQAAGARQVAAAAAAVAAPAAADHPVEPAAAR